jgi:hypothetical protein
VWERRVGQRQAPADQVELLTPEGILVVVAVDPPEFGRRTVRADEVQGVVETGVEGESDRIPRADGEVEPANPVDRVVGRFGKVELPLRKGCFRPGFGVGRDLRVFVFPSPLSAVQVKVIVPEV